MRLSGLAGLQERALPATDVLRIAAQYGRATIGWSTVAGMAVRSLREPPTLRSVLQCNMFAARLRRAAGGRETSIKHAAVA
jgi:hypothetical protein